MGCSKCLYNSCLVFTFSERSPVGSIMLRASEHWSKVIRHKESQHSSTPLSWKFRGGCDGSGRIVASLVVAHPETGRLLSFGLPVNGLGCW
jgi:hypothetical protein